MKKTNSKRLLTLVLALVLVFALSVGAYAAWPSFQKDATNNGTVPSGVTPPTGSSPTITSLQLSTNGYPFVGVDAAPVIYNNNAYVVRDGGTRNGTDGGARLTSVSLTNNSVNWDIQLGSKASDDFQLCTPYYDANDSAVYAGVSYYDDNLDDIPMSYWNSGAISGGVLTIPANSTVTLTLTAFGLNGAYLDGYFSTDIMSNNNGDFSGTVSMYHWSQQTLYSFGESTSYAGSYFSLYNNYGTLLPSGTYDVIITLTNNTNAPVTSNHIGFMCYKWSLYKVSISNNAPSTPVEVADGNGQINTPITAYSNYLYFGIYQGDRSYYQLNTSLPDSNPNYLLRFSTYSGEGYYWAGAAVVGDYVYFGSEEGKVYKRPIGSTFGSATGSYVNLGTFVSGPGAVRSSICYDGSNLYLTTRNGYLWKLDTDLTVYTPIIIKDLVGTQYIRYSTSTPVVSSNGYIYVGGFNYVEASGEFIPVGGVRMVPVSDFDQDAMEVVKNITGDGIQCSIVTYSTTYYDEDEEEDLAIDYLYYAGNNGNGKGYCITYVPYTQSEDDVWDTGSCGTNYALQGFAVAENGKMVFGNDSNKLFIVG